MRCVDAEVNVDAYDETRNLLYNGPRECGFECIKPEGAFYLFMKTQADEKEFARRPRNITCWWFPEVPLRVPAM